MAIRDKSQRAGFVYANIYEIYRKAKASAPQASAAGGAVEPAVAQRAAESRVWRADELRAAAQPSVSSGGRSSGVIKPDVGQAWLSHVQVAEYQPPRLSPAYPPVAPAAASPSVPGANPFDDLKSNLNRLRDLHSRLRFMLKELEDLVNKK